FTAMLLPPFGGQSRDVQNRYRALAAELAAIGRPASSMGPVISDFPIWWAEAERAPALALPDEPPASVLALAHAFPGTRYLVMSSPDHGRWPAVLAQGGAEAACFRAIDLGSAPDSAAT